MFFSLGLTGILLIASASDLKQFRIPNVIPIALAVMFLVKAAVTAETSVWPWHLIAFGLTFALGFIAFTLGLFGGGDAKLMSAIALWIGLHDLPTFLTLTAIGGGVLALSLIAVRRLVGRSPIPASASGSTSLPSLLDREAPVPYAVPMTMAALWLEWL